MWSGIWSVATTRIDFQTWIWSTRLVDWDRKSLVDSILEKLNLFCLTGLITLALLMWKWMGLFLRRNLLRCWGCLSLLNWIGAYIISVAKTASKKIGALKLLSPEVALISINLPYGHTWTTIAMHGLVLLAATWNCYISYKNGYVELLLLHLLPLLNPWLIVEM